MAADRHGDEPGAAQRLRALAVVEHPRFELIPLTNVLDESAHLPPGATVTVTASPAKGMQATMDLSVSLISLGFDVIPHLSARQIADKRELGELISQAAAAGIEEIFVVGGDAEDFGEFGDGLALLEALDEVGHPFVRIGVPGYPEGHPRISDEQLARALSAKTRLATSVATQMCFDDKAIAEWIAGQRARGVELPVFVGIPGVAPIRKLASIAARIGVGDSARFLSSNPALLGKLVRPGGYSPDELLLSLAADEAWDGSVAGLHIYTFNQVASTERWRRRFVEQLRRE